MHPRPVLARSASMQAATEVETKVVVLSSDEYEEFLAQNDTVLVDYYTE